MNSDFQLQQPLWLGLILALPAAWYLRRFLRRPASVRFAPARLFEGVVKTKRSFAALCQTSLFYVSCVCFVFAMARPQYGTSSSQIKSSGIDIMLLLDVSRSMLSEDFSIGSDRASRIDVVKGVTDKFIGGRKDDRVGIICFAGRPYLVSPLTLDHDWLLQNLDRVEIGLTEDGTAIGSALVTAANRLRDRQAKSRVIVLLTDGDNNAGKVPPLTAAEAVAAVGIKIYTIGIGTNGLVPFPETDQLGNKFYRQAYMPFQEDTCKRIAEIGGGKFYRATDTTGLNSIFADIDKLEKTEIELHESHDYHDLFPWFVGLGLATLAICSILGETFWRTIP